jgi:pimeloyl-ACP methyl ester carboxylesterase
MDWINKLNYRVFGNGYPVVFLHGFLESTTMWNYLDLEKAPFQSILIDLPGHGDSGLNDTNESPSMKYMAAEVAKLLAKLNIEEYHVVGHSMGGYVALELKELDPKSKKVVLLNSNFWEDPVEKKKDRVRIADIVLKAKDLFVNEAIPGLFYRHNRKDSAIIELIKESRKMEAASIAYASLAMRNRLDKSTLVKGNAIDFLILHGKHDPIISTEKWQSELKDISVSFEIIEDAGHMSHIENPTKILKSIVDFIVSNQESNYFNSVLLVP